jgi:hypothetical protein
VQEVSQARDISQPNVPSAGRRSRCRPVHRGGNVDVCIASLGSEVGERAEVSREVAKLVAECLTKQNVAFNLSN